MAQTNSVQRRGAAALGHREYAFLAAVMLACLAGYASALGGPLFFDDIPNLLDNRLMQIDGWEFDDWRVAIISNDSGFFHRPVAMLTFTLNYVAAGDFSPLVFKGTNLAIHILTGWLIYLLCRALLRAPALAETGLANQPWVAMVAAALWLLHPLHVSTVLYVVQRMAQLSTLFTVLGLVIFCRYRLRWVQFGAPTGEIIAAGLWLALVTGVAVLSKENGALLPWLIVVLEVSLFRGVWAGRPNMILARLGWVMLLLPVVLVALLLLASPELITARYSGRDFTLEERVLTQARLLWRYIGWIVLPNITAMGFFHDDIPTSQGLFSPLTTALSLLAWFAVTIAALRLRREYPLLLFALLFYLVGHALESTIVALELVFEHRSYLPSIAICLLVAAALFQLADRFPGLRPRVFVLVALIALSLQLLFRTLAWTDEMSLARFNVVNHPDSPRANFYYGNALFERFASAGQLGLTEEEEKSLAIASRSHFVRMHSLAPGGFPAIVMLYQLDSSSFPALAAENDWLGKLEELARTRRLNASDRGALSTLAAVAQVDTQRHDLPRIRLIVDQLVLRYPRRLDLLALQYRLMAASPDADRDALRAHLQSAAGNNPRHRLLYSYLIQYHGADDVAATYAAIRTWMRLDTRRRELAVIRRFFPS